MTSKTFNSVHEENSYQQLNIAEVDAGIRVSVDHNSHGVKGVIIAPSDAPALALAILEAAGVENVPHDIADGSERALGYLIEYVGLQQVNERHAKEQAEFEAEALELLNAERGALGVDLVRDLSEVHAIAQEAAIAVARRARELAEMRAEK
ncbi:hypothetical protein AOZ07_02850 [Glutamicibacter halophytocola]|uniref:hypothetical protein n=1 Tax=Glutamicibacter halophytocola TaxID=1933880 RepID=UPI0006D4C39B|nr:hypothetical protein [Glutamicibacter halophytocola]ALG28039.1 hypothetical protein AOZ07_02850 [Glutamicibacter halophytocola]